mgnify:CR=1 FL=1
MNEQNEKSLDIMTNHPSKIFEKPFKETPFNIIKEKYNKNELNIEDILSNNECINDLKTNSNSKYKKILSTRNIQTLIRFCLYPAESNPELSYKTLRYPYFSCEILCSPCILQFSKSIKSIKEANDLEKQSDKEGDKKEEEDFLNISNRYSSDENGMQVDYFEEVEQNQEKQNNIEDFFYSNEIEKFMKFDEFKETETEIQKDTMENMNKSQFNDEEKIIIENIFKTIFNFLDLKFDLDETYVGYFQKIVIFLLLNEPTITIEYLFNEEYMIIKKFYTHMNNASMENTFENILNYISDQENREDNLDKSKFNLIMIELLDEIGCKINKEYNTNNKKELNNYNDDKNIIEFICELIIYTLINNTEKHLIKLVFNSEGIFLKKIIVLIEHSIKLEFKNDSNHKKTLIINLIKIVRQINSVIMNSNTFINNNNIKDELDFFKDTYKEIKTIENRDNHYFCKKSIDKDNIYTAFVNNRKIYMSFIYKIFCLIKQDIIINPYFDTEKTKGKTRLSLHEWKYILSSLKLFIFQYYVIDNFSNEKDIGNFYDKNLFNIALELYFKYPKNNIYQNIFIDMIKLLNFEKTPKYLINHFIKKQNIFIENIQNIIKAKDKYNLLLGPNIQILLIFYTSSNPELIQFYQSDKNKNEKNSKEKFFDMVKKRFERTFNDNYEFTMNEIFSDVNDSLDTFDGNDLDNATKIKFESFKTTVENYINKLNFDFDIMNNNLNNKSMSDQKESDLEETKSKTEITQNKIKDEKNEIITENIDTVNCEEPSLSRKTEMNIAENRAKS